jgi:uncharacterized protein YciI
VLYIIYCEDKDSGATEIRQRHRGAHLAYLAKHEHLLVLGGALLADDGDARLGSVLILNVRSRQEAEAFAAGEPFRNAGLYKSVKLTRMRRGQWNPAAAPKSPEGN